MPGKGEVMEGAMQQAAQVGRQFMGRDYSRASPNASVFTICAKLTHNNPIRKSGVTAMSANNTNKSSQINLRTSADTKAMIERAAALMGTSVSGFMLQNAYEAARRVVFDYDTLMLTQRDFEAFAASMEKPPKPKAALRKLMARR
jgi:uncharacterized protein (DUF1778 family)